jgi:NAD(P)-dependent dehydrogenase (short-subunit alcohol dehydrogenase family)
MFTLEKRTALVTGAGQGMGLGIARTLGLQGASLLVNDLFVERAEAACDLLRERGLRAQPLPFDVTDYDATVEAVSSAGDIDILVNNAGIPGVEGMTLKPFIEMTPADWRPQVDLNLYGTLNCTHAVLTGMRERNWGRIIVVSSDAGRVGTAVGTTLYGACKAAAVHLVRNLSQEVADLGITANAIALGPMNNLPEDIADYVARGIPIKRLGTAEDAGAAIAYLASEEASWVTGQLLPVNGGISPS